MENARELLNKFKAGTCTDEERLLVEKWMLHYRAAESSELSDADIQQSRKDIWKMVEQNRLSNKPVFPLWQGMLGAAVILIILSAGLWFFKSENPSDRLVQKRPVTTQDIRPGGDKAILTLADGSKILLEDAAQGEIGKQSGIRIVKTKDGQLIYTISDGSSSPLEGDDFNTIETPRGGQYQVILPDRSRVWLNAESSLRYPTTFVKGERKVQLSGEAYFEVAHNRNLPFKVETKGQVVEVLGTSFNINSYGDEPSTKTTLIEGSVKVLSSASKKLEILSPGQQSELSKSGRLSRTAGVDIQEAVAWKDQLFYFNNSDIESVMRQLSRWYNVKVEYEGKIPRVRLSGEMHRRTNASKVLEILSYFKIKYRIVEAGEKGQKIIISE